MLTALIFQAALRASRLPRQVNAAFPFWKLFSA